MSALGDRINRETTAGDLFRTVINAILEEKVKRQGGQTLPPIVIGAEEEDISLTETSVYVDTATSGVWLYEDAVGIWEFNKDAGESVLAADISGFGNHGTYRNVGTTVATTINSKLVYSFKGDGSSYITVGDDTDLQLSGSYTLMSFVKFSTTSPTATTPYILDKRTNATNNFAIFTSSAVMKIQAGHQNAGTVAYITATQTFTSGTWYGVAVSFSTTGGASAMTLVINGVGQLSSTATVNPPSPTGTVIIGADGSSSVGNFHQGNIYNTRIYPRAMDIPEMKRYYQHLSSYWELADYA